MKLNDEGKSAMVRDPAAVDQSGMAAPLSKRAMPAGSLQSAMVQAVIQSAIDAAYARGVRDGLKHAMVVGDCNV